MICTRKEFLALTGIKQNGHLTTFIGRGKVVLESDGTIDTENRINKDFIASRSSKGISTPQAESLSGVVPVPKVVAPTKEPVSKKVKQAEDKAKISKWEVDLEKAKAELEYKLVQTKLGEQRLSTLMGNNLPIEFVKEVTAQLSKAMINNYKSFSEQHISEICHKHRISESDRVKIITKNTSGLNKIHEKAINDARVQLKNAIGNSRLKEAESDEQDDL